MWDSDLDLSPLTCPDRLASPTDDSYSIDEWLDSNVFPPDILAACPKWPDTLLDPACITQNNNDPSQLLNLCISCHQSLSRNKIPALAFANMIYIGSQPPEFHDLQPIEEAMIALNWGMCMILQLREKDNSPMNPTTDTICPPNTQKFWTVISSPVSL